MAFKPVTLGLATDACVVSDCVLACLQWEPGRPKAWAAKL
eukprot:CAMPEP_0115595136 /NCGR_PEP_ID=MMETSP0272-20121206/12164_1 /TAXON_ID=71861 /ORGANISM="Scrippsiella trochoidea, Strain CCMP3099" /LENGTH=39 /DNA_ID= /DNA_START= /DNA_END= /DNA_ORIENTATION=